jgi:hypothetical protein
MDTSQLVITLSIVLSVAFFFLRYAIPSMRPIFSWLGVGFALLLLGGMLYPSRSTLAQETLPGFSSTFALKIKDAATINKQYLFEFATPEGSKVSFYFSDKGDRFIFAVTDVGGNTQSLDMPIGSDGIPLGKFVFLTNEVGVATNATYLRTLINGKEVESRSLKVRMDLGSRNWVTDGTIGADRQGKNNGAFDTLALGEVSHVTLTDVGVGSTIKRVSKYLRDINSPVAKDL